MNVLVATATGMAFGLAALRWLRVSQREHYIVGWCTRFAARWWTSRWENVVGGIAAVVSAVAAMARPPAGFVTAALAAAGPIGLGLRGRTSPLRWTPRLYRLASMTAIVYAACTLVGFVAGVGPRAAVVAALLAPILVDVAAALDRPLERRLSEGFVRRARDRLRTVAPTVVAITGSYGKTTTKQYVRHILSGARSVVASPASFNNRLGLARAINDHLTPGTDVFVAEMGAYGEDEIAALTEWIRPDVSVITAVGPMHLERFGSVEAIARAKAEIVDGARAVVINADSPLIHRAVGSLHRDVRVVRCSLEDPKADVYVRTSDGALVVQAGGEPLAEVEGDLFAMNVACAVGVALELDVPREVIARRLAGLPSPGHRRQVAQSPRGVTVIDDTYNANPTGAAAALDLLARAARDGGRRVVVTPGMVELGREQAAHNRAFAERAARTATDVVVVGRTNRRALVAGSTGGPARVEVLNTRDQAVEWIRKNLGSGDAVLYENDLPDHYP